MRDWVRNKKIFYGVVLGRFDYIQNYYFELAEFIKGKLSSIEEILGQLNSADEVTKDMYLEDYSLDHYQIKRILEDNFTKSILISLYSFIENSIIFACKKLDYELNINEYSGYRGCIVKQSQKYITDKLRIRLSQGSEQFIKAINIVRNIFTHTNGCLDNIDNNKINTLVKFSKYNGVKGLVIDTQKKEISITFDFIDYCIEHTKEYFKEIFQC
jgi:hypothetical protein